MKEALKIKPKRLADEAFEIISTWIEGGRFAPGAHLSEGGLCADLGISRTPLLARPSAMWFASVTTRMP